MEQKQLQLFHQTELDKIENISTKSVQSVSKVMPISSHYHQEARIIFSPNDVFEFVKTIPDQSVNLVITSPPYNIGKEYEKSANLSDYLQLQEALISELVRVLKENGSLCWQVGNYVQKGELFPLDLYFYPIFKERFNLKLRNRIIWYFGHGLHNSKRFSGRYETVLWLTKNDDYTFNLDPVRIPSKYPGKRHYKGQKKGQPSGNPQGKNPSDVWEIITEEWETGLMNIPNVKSNHCEKTEHPCQFPVELIERFVLALTNEDDTIFDPFAGVGSSLIAGIKHNRRVIGTEKEPKYYHLATQRIYDYQQGILPIRPLGKPVYQPTGKEKISQIPQEWQQIN
jgi:DNA modification methylase